jgi:hypothetical protein
MRQSLKYFIFGMASMLAWQDKGYLTHEFGQAAACTAKVFTGNSCSAAEKNAFIALPKSVATDFCGPLKPNCQAFLHTGIH